MGLRGEELDRLQSRPWREIVKKHEWKAERAEHLLHHYLSYFGYDTKKATDFAIEFAGKQDIIRELGVYMPALAEAKTADEEEEVLVRAAQEESADLLPAMALLLASPTHTGNGSPDNVRRPRS